MAFPSHCSFLFRFLLLFPLFGFVLTGVLSCGNSDGGPFHSSNSNIQRSEFVTHVDIEQVSLCSPDSEPNNKALFENLNKKDIKEPFLGKRINLALLEGILQASTPSTIDYIRRQGIRIARVSNKKNGPHEEGCHLFDALPEATASELVLWQKKEKELRSQVGPTTPVFLQGFFSGKIISSEYTILIFENADRWVLLHEYTHYLYLLEKIRGKDLNTALQFDSEHSEQEEYSIESLLQDYYKNGLLKNVSPLMQAQSQKNLFVYSRIANQKKLNGSASRAQKGNNQI